MYLLRHGATANNLAQPPLLQGRAQNPQLSPQGRRQAHAAATALADREIAAVYSSPLTRAVETAEFVAKEHALETQTVDAIIEVDVGRWEGGNWKDISKDEPDAYRRFVDDPAMHGYAGGENLGQVADRVRPAFEMLMDQHLGQAIVVVAHNVVNRVYLAGLLAIPVRNARSITQDNCGINIIRHRQDKDRIITLNTVLHLPVIEG
jgi:broad specificity phosphatase PhoE